MLDADPVRLIARDLLRERAPALLEETCAWAVGLSDRPWLVRRGGRLSAGGPTLGARALADLPLTAEGDEPVWMGEARPGSFRDALGALGPDGRPYADLLDDEVVRPYVLRTCVAAAERAREQDPEAFEELVDELGEDPGDLEAVVRAAEWEVPLVGAAGELVVDALGDVPLVEVEAEGLPLSLVRAAESETRRAASEVVVPDAPALDDDVLAGALFLAEAAVHRSALALPVRPADAPALLRLLLEEGLEAEEVRAVLPGLPVSPDAAERVEEQLDAL